MDRRITNSQLTTDASCSRLHFFRYMAGGHGITRDYHQPALSIGSAVHEGIDAFVRAKQAGERDETVLREIAVDAALVEYQKSLPDDNEIDRLYKWHANQQQVAAILDAYAEMWSEADKDIEWLGSEVEWEAPILNPETGRAMRRYVAAGKYDKLFRRNGKIVLRDHKTTSEQIHPGSAYVLNMRIDSQVSHYVLGLQRSGIIVDEVEWDMIRKPGITLHPSKLSAKQFAELRETETYLGHPVKLREHIEGDIHKVWVNDRPCPVSLLKKNIPTISENWEMYRIRAYTKLRSELDRYFRREIIPITAARLDDYSQELFDKVKMLRERERTGRWPRNTKHCRAFGRLCPFFDLCVMGYGVDSDYDDLHPVFRKLNDSHEELSQPQQEEDE